MISGIPTAQCWLGATKLGNANIRDYYWMDHTHKLNYTNWDDGYPKNDDPQCLSLTNKGDGKWWNYTCHSTIWYICEKQLMPHIV